jgi:hypothetical protein
MSTLGGPMRRPTPIAGAMVALTVRVLPPGHRDRYDDEFRAELCLLRPRRQIPQATGLLVGAVTLRGALKERDMSIEMNSIKFWKCRIGRHRYRLVTDDNPENRRSSHLECTRCLKFKEIKEYTPSDGKYLTGGGIGM